MKNKGGLKQKILSLHRELEMREMQVYIMCAVSCKFIFVFSYSSF